MKVSDLISLSTRNLARRKGRTALTVVGVVVGTCAVIVMISLGIAMNQSNEEMIAGWGDLTQIEIYGGGMMGGDGSSNTKPAQLDEAMLQSFQALPHVVAVTPQVQTYSVQGSVYGGKGNRYKAEYSNMGIGFFGDAMADMGYTLTDGNWLSDSQNYGKDKIPVLVCEQTAYNFCDTRKNPNSTKYQRWAGQTDSAGKEIPPFFDINDTTLTLTLTNNDQTNPKTKEYQLVVVGTVANDTSKGWWTQSGMAFRVKDVLQIQEDYKALTGDHTKTNTTYDDVFVKVDEVNNVEKVDETIQDMGFKGSTSSMTSIRDSLKKQVGQSQMILGGLAAISLLVAALNIANTMTMAIYERTREIGVMKVLGCELGQIRAMFLIESGCIGLIGGCIGSVVSLVISFILNNISIVLALFGSNTDASELLSSMGGFGSSSTISIVPPWLVAAALLFATCIGLLSGVAPANRAVKISALEAIRHD